MLARLELAFNFFFVKKTILSLFAKMFIIFLGGLRKEYGD